MKCSAVLAVTLLLPGAVAAQARRVGTIDPICAKLLAPEDLGRIAGKPDVQLAPYNPAKGAGGTCDYATPDGKLLMLFTWGHFDAAQMPRMYAQCSSNPIAQPVVAVNGVGDQAVGWGAQQQGLCVQRGGDLLSLVAFYQYSSRPTRITGARLTREQLVAAAKLILSHG
ncbi:MAG TPA: hypothetical protein VL563_18030 [Gemmatimonadales bacterium]|jgi:hypothetical protein|nr:hypothetical protein [Gemmatimonadales bacterium]